MSLHPHWHIKQDKIVPDLFLKSNPHPKNVKQKTKKYFQKILRALKYQILQLTCLIRLFLKELLLLKQWLIFKVSTLEILILARGRLEVKVSGGCQ